MKKIGVALYNDFRGSLESFFSFLHKLGVDYVEIGKEWIPQRRETRRMRDLLEIYDLKAGVVGELPGQEIEETWEVQPRMAVPTLPAEQRKMSFAEVELSFSEERARQEAKRCLRCDLEK